MSNEEEDIPFQSTNLRLWQQILINAKEKPANQRNVVESLVNEVDVLYQGLTNQEYLDFCFIKGASQQTIPLVLLVPTGLLLGLIVTLTGLMQNLLSGDPVIWSINKFLFSLSTVAILLYLLLKTCEIVPKKIKDPLLFGRITTYGFTVLIIFEGVFFLEKMVVHRNPNFYVSEFWVTFALLIWQKVLINFIYDFKLRFLIYCFLYPYYAFRIGNGYSDYFHNLIKVFIYIVVEAILIIDVELKNYSQYQTEKSVLQCQSNYEDEPIKFMIPPVSMAAQAKILQTYSDNFPVAIFDKKKELLHLSGVMQKQLKLDIQLNDENEIDLVTAEIKLRKLEVLQVYNQKNEKKQLNKLKKKAKFGASCGTNENGELLHALLHGPPLQQLRNGVSNAEDQQDQQNSNERQFSINPEGLLEQTLNDLINNEEQDTFKGLLQYKILRKESNKKNNNNFDIIYFQFQLCKLKREGDFDLILILDEVTSLIKFNEKHQVKQTEQTQEIQQICTLGRSLISNLQQLDSKMDQSLQYTLNDNLRHINNLEINCQKDEWVHLTQNKVDFLEFKEKIDLLMKEYETNKDFKHCVSIDPKLMQEEFYNDLEKMSSLTHNLISLSIENIKQGSIKIMLEPDIRQNCIQLRMEDNNSVLIKESDLVEFNNCAKLLGPYLYKKKVNGYVCGVGISYLCQKDVGNVIIVSFRNFKSDNQERYFLIDEEIEEDEIDVDQDEILERYLMKQREDIKTLVRTSNQLKCLINKNKFKEIKQEQKVQEKMEQQVVKPKLAGLAKLQESGRLKTIGGNRGRGMRMTQTDNEEKEVKCQCDNILIINSDVLFSQIVNKLEKINKIVIANEQEGLKELNKKVKDQSCCSKCIGFKYLVINAVNGKVNYKEWISQLIKYCESNLCSSPQSILLNYHPYGNMEYDPSKMISVTMPSNEWMKIINE